jgi:hypothetical protein
MDFNELEKKSMEFIENKEFHSALRIYFYMADGDPSLDAGYLGLRIGKCYELLGELYAAKYWYGRAVEEGSGAWPEAEEGVRRLDKEVNINDIL